MRVPASSMRHMSLLVYCLVAAFGLVSSGAAYGQGTWRPDKPVEIILPTGAGGLNDQMARLIQKVLQDRKLVTQPVLVMNKAGGNQTLAPTYLRQHPGNPHYLLYSTSSIFTAEINGLIEQHYSDLTPIALMMIERTAISVAADSPIKNMRDLIDRLAANPGALSIGMATRGGSNHLGLSQVVKSAGIDPKRLRTVVFKSNVESLMGLSGGHLQVVTSSATAAAPWVQNGQARIIGVLAPQRLPGPLAGVPTLREQGFDVSGVTNWRGVLGPRGLTSAHVEFWEDAMAKVVATEEWKKILDQNHLAPVFLRAREFAKFLETEYQTSKSVLTELGFAKQAK